MSSAPSTVSRALSKANLTRKKSLKPIQAYREENQRKRVNYWEIIQDINPKDLVFLDETGINLAMIGMYARSEKGKRAYSQKFARKGKNFSIIGVITLTVGWLAGFSFEGGTTGDVFFVVCRGSFSATSMAWSSRGDG